MLPDASAVPPVATPIATWTSTSRGSLAPSAPAATGSATRHNRNTGAVQRRTALSDKRLDRRPHRPRASVRSGRSGRQEGDPHHHDTFRKAQLDGEGLAAANVLDQGDGGNLSEFAERRDGAEQAHDERACPQREREADQDDAARQHADDAGPGGVLHQVALRARQGVTAQDLGLQVEREVFTRNPATGLLRKTAENASYVCNAPVAAERAAAAIRAHWAFENTSNYTRDVTLGEDRSRIRTKPGVFARLRRFAFNTSKANRSATVNQDRYRAALAGVEHMLQFKGVA